jgi:hypothetical protein
MLPIQIASIDIIFEFSKNKIEVSFHPIYNKDLIIKKTFERKEKDEKDTYTSDIGKIVVDKNELNPDKDTMDNIAILTAMKCIDIFSQNDKLHLISSIIKVYSLYAGQKIKIPTPKEEIEKLQ